MRPSPAPAESGSAFNADVRDRIDRLVRAHGGELAKRALARVPFVQASRDGGFQRLALVRGVPVPTTEEAETAAGR